MGYYTEYSLTHNQLDIEQAEAITRYIDEDESLRYAIEEGQATKWYAHEEGMRRMSLAFPSVTFILKGHGEEYGDDWRKTFLGGSVIRKERGSLVWTDVEVSK